MRAFFTLAAQSPTRQQAFRRLVAAHLLVLSAGAWLIFRDRIDPVTPLLGHLLLVLGIIEGATLLGWRLTQLPKSQALEFLLATPLCAWRVFLAEALVGLAFLALTTLAGLPLLVLLVAGGRLEGGDLSPLLAMPTTWGALTGLGLTVWAYEPLQVRRWGERVILGSIVLQLLIGVLAGEHLRRWLDSLPQGMGLSLLHGFEAFHTYNPFAVLHLWLKEGPAVAAGRVWGVELAALAVLGVLLVRGAGRLQGHFHDRHYQVKKSRDRKAQGAVSFSVSLFPFTFRDQPLAWWAVKRVTEYSGRINLWLAGGFGILYALYMLAGPSWPTWLGRQIFVMCDQFTGVSGLAAGLVILAAVPAAFQYGLWDSSAQDRCRRLELLLLTHLKAQDYWNAAAAAAWRRGRGYLGVAVVLWMAAVLSGRMAPLEAATALVAAVLMWGFYFSLGFRAFSRGMQANSLGMLLTLVLPLLAYALFRLDRPQLATLLPVGSVYGAGAGLEAWLWLPGAVLAGALMLVLARRGLADCDTELRRWYEMHHGSKVMT